MRFVHECKIVVWTFSPLKPVLISLLGDVFPNYGFLLGQNELTEHLLEKGRKEIQILRGGKVLNMLSMPTRCIAQHAGLVGEQVKNVSFFVIHQHFHRRQVKTVQSKQVYENMFYLPTSSHSPIKKKLFCKMPHQALLLVFLILLSSWDNWFF